LFRYVLQEFEQSHVRFKQEVAAITATNAQATVDVGEIILESCCATLNCAMACSSAAKALTKANNIAPTIKIIQANATTSTANATLSCITPFKETIKAVFNSQGITYVNYLETFIEVFQLTKIDNVSFINR
jgi:hypothetical protein